MEPSQRSYLVVACSLVGAVIVGAIAFGLAIYFPSWKVPGSFDAVDTGHRSAPVRSARAASTSEVLANRAQMLELQRKLELRTEVLDHKNSELRQKQEEINALREQLVRAEELAALLAGPTRQPASSAADPATSPAADGGESPTDPIDPTALTETPVDPSLSEAEASDAREAAARESALAELELLTLAFQLDQSRSELRAESEARAIVLRRLGAALVPTLMDALTDPDPTIRRWACRALGDLRTAAMDAVPALQRASIDPDEQVRQLAATAVDRIRE